MRKRTKTILRTAILAGAVAAAAIPAMAQQQTSVQPFVPYNGTNGAGPLNPAAGPAVRNPNAPLQLYGVPYFTPYTGNASNYNPACDRNSQYYNPNACR